MAASVAVELGVLLNPADHSQPCNFLAVPYSCSVLLGSLALDTSSLYFYATTIAFLVQFLIITLMSTIGDFGSYRKSFFISFGIIGGISSVCIALLITDKLWWLAFLIYLIGSISFGISYVFHYAWLPVLIKDPKLIAAQSASKQEYCKLWMNVSDKVSFDCYQWGYVCGIPGVLIDCAIAYTIGRQPLTSTLHTTYSFQIAVAI
jgi:Vacuole effluxer Atg22 like